ncbi:DivIVA domain-containing protein [Brevibacterium sp.]|uniref:DivIVA domain-containing protein n=1 Tax=Brevibacterium sp. TaxID=1701 RepID=UPI002811A610|nr:DivIVA domain-containing protein [Brevibacterium sp.]
MPFWIVLGVAAAMFVLVIVLAASFNLFSSDAAEETEQRRDVLPPDFTSLDLQRVTFRPALRGYRMEEVDQVLDSLRIRLQELEARPAVGEAARPIASEPGTSATEPGTAAAER